MKQVSWVHVRGDRSMAWGRGVGGCPGHGLGGVTQEVGQVGVRQVAAPATG